MSYKAKFRAWYKPDFDTEDGPLKFIQIERDDELWFAMESDPEIAYHFHIPFMDDDWVLEQSTNLYDKNGTEVFEGDILLLNTNVEIAEKCVSHRHGENETKLFIGRCSTNNQLNVFVDQDMEFPCLAFCLRDDLEDFEVVTNIHEYLHKPK